MLCKAEILSAGRSLDSAVFTFLQSDEYESAITIIGVKLAGKKPDSKHPFGYGRVEYFSAIVIAGIIFAAGVSSMVESVKAIINPEQTSYTWVTVLVIVVAIAGKLVLGRCVARR